MVQSLLDNRFFGADRVQGTVHLTLRQPVLEVEMLAELEAALAALAADSAGSLILCSRHASVFLAGAHLGEIERLTAASARPYAQRGRAVARLIASFPAPTVAAVRGSCSGGGVDLVQACDLIVAGPNATFRHPGVMRGLVTGWSGTTVLPEAFGPSKIRRLFLEGRGFDAESLLAAGLVHAVRDEPEEEATSVALSLAGLDRHRLELWRACKAPRFIDRFRATVVHKLR